jgi:hypothetical protein
MQTASICPLQSGIWNKNVRKEAYDEIGEKFEISSQYGFLENYKRNTYVYAVLIILLFK